MDLTKKKCVPCEGGTKPMEAEEIKKYMSMLKEKWNLENNVKISRRFSFKDFKEAMSFVDKAAEIAEEEGHHPDMLISYNKVDVDLTTHAIGGLSINDFIMASKIERITGAS